MPGTATAAMSIRRQHRQAAGSGSRSTAIARKCGSPRRQRRFPAPAAAWRSYTRSPTGSRRRRRQGRRRRVAPEGTVAYWSYSAPRPITIATGAAINPTNEATAPGDALKAGTQGNRHVHDVAARQELAKAEHLGEFSGREPFALLDDHAPGPGQDAAETADADDEEAGEQGKDAWGTHSNRIAAGTIRGKPIPLEPERRRIFRCLTATIRHGIAAKQEQEALHDPSRCPSAAYAGVSAAG